MVHHKNFQVEDLSAKYGFNMVGYVAHEPIRQGEMIFSCDVPNCMYKDSNTRFNRNEINQLIEKHPEKKDYFYRYFFMLDDDVFGVPSYYKTMEVTCECPFVNHSCDPNCYYTTQQKQYSLVALRDIQAGEELCIHYGAHDTEFSLIQGIQCHCGASNCHGILDFNFWRDSLFQKQYEFCLSDYIKKKVNELRKEENKVKESNGH